MTLILQVLVGVVSVMMLGLGMASMFAPKMMLENFSVEPDGARGLNTIRGVIGGLFLGCVAMLLTGLATGATLWFLAVAIVLGAVVVGRLIGLVIDGFDTQLVPPIVLELVMVAVLLSAHVQLAAV